MYFKRSAPRSASASREQRPQMHAGQPLCQLFIISCQAAQARRLRAAALDGSTTLEENHCIQTSLEECLRVLCNGMPSGG